MKLVSAILLSLVAASAGAGALAFRAMHMGRLGLTSVPLGLAALIYAVTAFVLLTGGVFRDLATARGRLDRAVAELPAVDWTGIFAGSAFAAISGQLAGEELRLAPLSLLRVLRAELWRAYAKRLVAGECPVLALAAVAIAVRAVVPVGIGLAIDGAWLGAGALLLVAILAGIWLALDAGFGHLSTAVTQACGFWPGAVPVLAPAAAAAAPALPPDVVAALAASSGLAREAATDVAAALAGLQPVLDRIEETLRRREQEPGLTEALGAVAGALEKLAAAPAAPRRDELEQSLRSMGATLAAVAEAVRALDRRPRSVTDELDELLDEISDLAPPGAPRVA